MGKIVVSDGKAHKKHTRNFEELSFAEQAWSLNATMLNLWAAINAHIRKACELGRDTTVVKNKCNKHIKEMLNKVEKL
ncbi:MAG: hypothetical protein M0Q46_05550 [Endomicrobiales bacterium]|nr:hypothetical protein [Endomicrobiales bacterium]